MNRFHPFTHRQHSTAATLAATPALFVGSLLFSAGCGGHSQSAAEPEAPAGSDSLAPSAQPGMPPQPAPAVTPISATASAPTLATPAPAPVDTGASSAAAANPAGSSAPKGPCADGSVLVPGGKFTTSGMKINVEIGPLCVDATETTAAAYAECVTAGACNAEKLDCAEQATYGKPDRQNHPIVCVTFEQAQAYCSYRQKRLPRTEEWEWVARGAEMGRRFPWGDDAPKQQLCWSGAGAQPMSCPVASHPTGDSAHGIADLAGNVLEFTTTSLDAKSKVRIARGGSWKDGAQELVRVSRVGGFELHYRCGFLGIRCVQDAPKTQ